MLCCIIGFAILIRFVYEVDIIKEILGFKKNKTENYDTNIYCELDDYED